MTTRAADCYADIHAAMAKIRVEERQVPKCPLNEYKNLAACLRDTSRCPAVCPLVNDWIGPDKA
jgi:hypothetical protein